MLEPCPGASLHREWEAISRCGGNGLSGEGIRERPQQNYIVVEILPIKCFDQWLSFQRLHKI
jgi:hypothetical protein